jgi:PelA/Pel-15E family pectate lyase
MMSYTDSLHDFGTHAMTHIHQLIFRSTIAFASLGITLGESPSTAAEALSQEGAAEQLRDTIAFYRSEVGYQGAYLWRYSADLTQREGEGTATRTSGWTQPPGSPSVGEAYLKAWRLSGEKVCLDSAVEVANALVKSQLVSGGWSYHFDLGPEGATRYAYRIQGETEKRRNHTTFDDNKSQSALTLLMHVDEALEFRDAEIHEAVEYALKNMLAAQYPNGAWPQQFTAPPNPDDFPTKKASYPEKWSRTYVKVDYREHYTLNDNNMSFIIDMLLEAERIYQRKDCRQAAEKTGDFFLLAQMPEPQPGWAQQYNREMHPAWARKFEPAAITGGESQSVMRTLISLYRYTGEKRFLEPLPRALAYYRSSLLADGRLARFYELRENKPLYFTKDYKLTYSDADMPTHYGFKTSSKLDSIQRAYDKALSTPTNDLRPRHEIAAPVRRSKRLAQDAKNVVDQLDDRGAWVEAGKLRYQSDDAAPKTKIIQMETYIRNLEILAKYVGAE